MEIVVSNLPQIEIIAELAQGFEGNPGLAHLLVKAAAAAGANAAKFQLVYADELATPDYKHYELFKGLEMEDEVWAGVAAACRDVGIALNLDVFGSRSLALAETLGVETVKLHGTDISNLGFLAEVAGSKVPRVMLGAGGALASEIEQALDILAGKQVIVMLGFQGYPTPNDTNQIARVAELMRRWTAAMPQLAVGFADHAPPEDNTRFALAATALGAGARILEKHLTLGRNMKLEDFESALNPDEFEQFCVTLRACAAAFGASSGNDDFAMSEAEMNYRKMIRRHVVAARPITAGTVLGPADLVLKRSGADTYISDLDSAYGRKAVRALEANDPVLPDDLSEAGE